MTDRCPVCEQGQPSLFQTIKSIRYNRCPVCMATLMAPECRLNSDDERAVYALHNNDPHDSGYRRFLSRLTGPLEARVPTGSRGLDFGCGPGPALATMLEEAGMVMSLYDPYFYPDTTPLERQYDFVTCTEVVEHLHQPAQVFRQLDDLIKPGGWLGIMTCFQTEDSRFANWHYRRDPTHVVFYRQSTLQWLADQYRWTLEVPAKDVALFQKLKT
ncbi:class I SAM-dependent methyltransferase [Marinobacter sp. CHS3-4]|uniref:class I SAM-dependent methyltransferase n=1 Tax=Marinobacter sp. CHS3-4 TaxID=3045174 RepID=UPI0024B576E4|nr:class I SAM-dependent methyltransferase [Marinobacter sp. CHS3-4]MDI9246047.1 class I SAM-dependent methyltransferase [Marinobacter sp. CHS3-4]